MVFIITGANRGIGKYLYEYYKDSYSETYGTYHTSPPIMEDVHLSKVDITSRNEVESWIQGLSIENKQIILINTAGILKQKYAHKADMDDWNEVVNINLIGTMNVIRSVLPIMREANFGRIINFSSIAGTKGIAGTSAYAASKSGLLGLTRAIAVENASLGITINCIGLGYFDIGMTKIFTGDLLKGILQAIPMKKLGNKVNIIKAIDFLIDCDYMTGTSLDINGGLV